MNERDIFIEVIQAADAAQGQALVDELCGGDRPLRERVVGLLDAHRRAANFLESPPTAFANVATTESSAAERPGMLVGRYKLLQQIGEGGMGVVFMAEQTEPVCRKVAIKVIKPGMDSRAVVARFEAERQALAMMDHANIARVFDAGTTEAGRPYFVMELVHGIPITKYCDDNHLTPRARLELFLPVCHAMQHAHQKGIIHRDIKPSNVMVALSDGRPTPKVIDFGVAKATEQNLTEKTLFTQFGGVVGTLEYMSPEQAEMSTLGIDTRSDIYSLGVLLYELLTGSTPLSQERLKQNAYAEIIRVIKEVDPPLPSTRLTESRETLASISAQRQMEPAKLAKLVRGELDWIVMKALDKDRNRRYETANAFASDVQCYLADEPVLACPPSAAYRLGKLARRHKAPALTIGLVFLSLIGGIAISTWQALRATAAGELAETRLSAETAARAALREQLLATQQAESNASHRLFDATLAQANATHLSRRLGQRFESLKYVAEATELGRQLELPESRILDLRNAAIAAIALPDLRSSKRWPHRFNGKNDIEFDDKLEKYVRVNQFGAASLRRVADDREIVALPAIGSGKMPILNRDANMLAVVSSTGGIVWNLTGSSPTVMALLTADDTSGFAFNAQSTQCAVGHADGSVSVHGLPDWEIQREIQATAPPTCLAFQPGDQRLAIARGTVLEIHDLQSEHVVRLPHPAEISHVAWHPSGQSLAVPCNTSQIFLWDLDATKQPRLILEGLRNKGVLVAFNHRGSLLASMGWESILRLWDPRTGEQLFHVAGGITRPQFSLDDRLLAGELRDSELGLWEVAAHGEYRTLCHTLTAGDATLHNVSIRNDGRLLAAGMLGGVGLWDLAGGKELAFIKLPESQCVLFEPSGALLTIGRAGLFRWPVRVEPGVVHVGPPQKLPIPGAFGLLASSRDGHVVASSQFNGAMALLADRPDRPVRLGPHADVRYISVSPDGDLIATGSFAGKEVKIWQSQSGKLVKVLPLAASAVKFSPDGKWLATTAGGVRLWEVGTWREAISLEGAGIPAFSPDGRLLALQDRDGALRLLDPVTGREYARLEDPHQDRTRDMTFSADNSRLVSCNDTSKTIHVWDLRAIRKQLMELNLDWEQPPYPTGTFVPPAQIRVEIDYGKMNSPT